ncbi:hypothetical protein RDI58_005496 [Solanum bulbocastanum]|uniref:Uncharacterized protein n=1 Tax=Solanum bulbocastanum TaxID=147425 RepID=A0AAN8U3C4_SOLBU
MRVEGEYHSVLLLLNYGAAFICMGIESEVNEKAAMPDQQDYTMVCANTKTNSRSHIGLLTLVQQWLLLLLYFVELIIPIPIDFSINPNGL